MITIVSSKLEGSRRLLVTVQGDSFTEVSESTAKNAAIDAASKQLGLCGISGSSGPYPVDANGNEIKDFSELSKLLAAPTKRKTATAVKSNKCVYRNDFTINQSLGL